MEKIMSEDRASTASETYTQRLQKLGSKRIKRILKVQEPYRRRYQKIIIGSTLDIGCGVGRVLQWLSADSVGVDHNPMSVDHCRKMGLRAFTNHEFDTSVHKEKFDNLLLAHLLEHLSEEDQIQILRTYLPCLKEGGKIIVVTPQQRGYKSDSTHITYTDGDEVALLFEQLQIKVDSSKSFPFPRVVGRVFTYNEFQVVGIK
jgi:2-polyprenyl-3-methyl-5-hydroxy-6-metoxy-1,4-benzoquinol methylase